MLLAVTLIVSSICPALAAHDHPHVAVTLIDYQGFLSDSEHFVMEVKEVYDGKSYYYFLHFTDPAAKGFKGHEGEKVEISISEDGKTWERARLHDHATVNIHSKVQSRPVPGE